MTNLKNPKEAIYLMLFEKPMNLKEISRKLYGKHNTKVSTYLTELESDGWIKYVRDYYRFKEGRKKDGRENYYESTPKGLLESINKDLNKLSKEYKKDIILSQEQKDPSETILLVILPVIWRKINK
jgi:DNA-binding transcriptional regulator GbsR (MarR family)